MIDLKGETAAAIAAIPPDIDVEHCPNCGGSLKIIAAIEDPPVIVKILSHLGLPTRAPPRSPARRVDLFQTT